MTDAELAAVSALVHELRELRRAVGVLVSAIDGLVDTLLDEVDEPMLRLVRDDEPTT